MAIAALALLLSVPAYAQAPAAGNAQVEAPAVLAPGDEVVLAVRGFHPGREVQVVLMGPGPTARMIRPVSGPAITDAQGSARWRARVPEDLHVWEGGPWWLNWDDAEGRWANRLVEVRWSSEAAEEVPTVVAATATLALTPWPTLTPLPTFTPTPQSTFAPLPTFTALPTFTPTAPPALAPAVAPTPTAPLPPTSAGATPARLTPIPLGAATRAIVAGDGGGQDRSFVTSYALTLRGQPSPNGAYVGGIPVGARLTLLDGPVTTRSADYYQVRTAGGLVGWAAPHADDLPGSLSTSGAYRLRLEPDNTSPVRGLVPSGTQVEILAHEPGPGGPWARVRLPLADLGVVTGYLPTAILRPQ